MAKLNTRGVNGYRIYYFFINVDNLSQNAKTMGLRPPTKTPQGTCPLTPLIFLSLPGYDFDLDQNPSWQVLHRNEGTRR
ncbi:MAG: hypothetical protein LBQ90_11900, partial [Synergistaceae bacterium]|nr:hypothetical protein [Synergistaceae bacterium]